MVAWFHYLVVAHAIDVDQDDVRARTDRDKSSFEETRPCCFTDHDDVMRQGWKHQHVKVCL